VTLRVPALPAGVSVAVAAQAYAANGWYVLPVNPLTKHAGSVLGTGWPERSTRNAGMVRFLFAGDVGLALHVGRSGAVVFDVDRPDLLPELLKEHLDVHDGPFQSTRQASPGRGHYCYLHDDHGLAWRAAAPLAAGLDPAEERLVGLDIACEQFPARQHHYGPVAVQHRPSGLVGADAQGLLQLQGTRLAASAWWPPLATGTATPTGSYFATP